jgi:cytochrome c6
MTQKAGTGITMRGRPPGIPMLLALLLWAAVGDSANAADTNKGGKLYTARCVSCHGGQGVSAAPGSPSFERGQNLLRPDFTLLEAIRTGKNAMPTYQGMLTNRDILDIIAYMRTLH